MLGMHEQSEPCRRSCRASELCDNGIRPCYGVKLELPSQLGGKGSGGDVLEEVLGLLTLHDHNPLLELAAHERQEDRQQHLHMLQDAQASLEKATDGGAVQINFRTAG